MDKPNKGSTITIKINGEQKTFQEELPKDHSEDAVYKEADIHQIPSNSAKVFSETAAAQESTDESFDWIIPESADDEIEEFKFKNEHAPKKSGNIKIASFSTKNNKKKNGSQPFVRIFISAVFAIVIGSAIGVFMLKLVISNPGKKAEAEPNTMETAGSAHGDSGSTKTTSASIEQMATYIIQGGIYSTEGGAKETVKELSAKGIPSQIVTMNDKTFIFLGVADSIETAKAISQHLKQNGAQDAFAKPLLVDGKKFSGLSDQEKAFIGVMPAVFKTFANTAGDALVSNEISQDARKALSSAEKQLAAKSIKNSNIQKLQKELIGAADRIKDFQKTKDSKNLLDAEQHLLNYLSIYYSLK